MTWLDRNGSLKIKKIRNESETKESGINKE
jgi:hypothetical protein